MMIFLGVLVLLMLFGGLGFATFYIIKKTDPSNNDTSVKEDITTAQELLPFEDIKDGMLIMGGHKYRAIIECTSTNYTLKTDAEKELIEISFQQFLNSLTFPISIYVQTETIDNTVILENLKKDLEQTIEDYPYMSEYANQYYSDMTDICETIGNNKRKRKFIVIPYEESAGLEKLTDEEKYRDSASELYNRCSLILDGLNGVGIRGTILNSAQIAELVYGAYHKENQGYAKGITSGEYQALFVEGEKNKLQQLPVDGLLDMILYEAEMKIKNGILLSDTPDFIKKNSDDCLESIEKLRDKYAGYFKEK